MTEARLYFISREMLIGGYMSRSFKLSFACLTASTALLAVESHAQPAPSQEQIARQLAEIQQQLEARRAEIERLERQVNELRSAIAPPAPTPAPTPDAAAAPTILDQMEDLPDVAPLSQQEELRRAETCHDGARDPGIAAMASRADLDRALADPNSHFRCLRLPEEAGRALAARSFNDSAAQPLVDRPNLRAGISGTITLGNTSEASLSYALPIILRERISYRDPDTGSVTFLGFNPRTLTLSLVVTTPLDKDSGTGRLFSDTERFTRANRDIPSGTRIRAGIDFLVFPTVSARRVGTGADTDLARSFEAQRRVVDILHAARQACVRHHGGSLPANDAARFHRRYGSVHIPQRSSVESIAQPANPLVGPVDERCTGDNLLQFLMATRVDAAGEPENSFVDPTLPARYLESFWGASAGVLPRWGWGASFEYGTRDFTFEQARSINYADPDPIRAGRVRVSFDPAQGFAPPNDDAGRANWTVRGYYLRNVGGWQQLRLSDILLVGSVEHSDLYRFRPRTEAVTICPANPGGVQIQCRAFNVDAPVQFDSTTLALEARLRLGGVPFLQNLNLAPRYSHRLDDGAQTIDIPLYLQNDASGFGTAGIRFRHSWGGRDLLGNDELKASDISLFFVPIRFSGP